MSMDPFTVIEEVERFLKKEVSFAVPQDLRSEVRAAAKLLQDARKELNQLPQSLVDDSLAMASLCEDAVTNLGIKDHPGERMPTLCKAIKRSKSITDALTLYQDVCREFESLLLELQRRSLDQKSCDAGTRQACEEYSARFIAFQLESSRKQMKWQSVFKNSNTI